MDLDTMWTWSISQNVTLVHFDSTPDGLRVFCNTWTCNISSEGTCDIVIV